MRIIKSGTKYSVYDNSIETFERLPAGTYAVGYTQNEGCFLIRRANIAVTEKTYGVHNQKVQKVMASFAGFERSLGVILSGDKGIGKSLFAKQLCQRAVAEGFPVVVVDTCLPGIGRFIESIQQECVVLFDEFDKTFRNTRDDNDQSRLLSLFDGTAGGKKLYVVTCNELYGLNHYIINRPGRFHYHFRFDYPTPEDIREYLRDKLEANRHSQIDRVVEFSRKISLNYDCLRAIAFELNRGSDFADAIADLNIMTTEQETYKVYLVFENGKAVHNFRYSTNLYDYDGTMSFIRFYDDNGKFALDAYFDKAAVRYDMATGKILVPPSGIKINESEDDDDYCDEDEENVSDAKASCFRGEKVRYMTFTKHQTKNLHYMI